MTTSESASEGVNGIIASLQRLSASGISDALDRLGIAGQCAGIMPADRHSVLAGRAFTVRYGPVGEDPGTVGDYIELDADRQGPGSCGGDRPRSASGSRWRPGPRCGTLGRPRTITGCKAAPVGEPEMCTANPRTCPPRNRRLAKARHGNDASVQNEIHDLCPERARGGSSAQTLCDRVRSASQSWLTISRHSPTIPTSA